MHFLIEILSQTCLYSFQGIILLLSFYFVMNFDVSILIIRWWWLSVISADLFSVRIYWVNWEAVILRISSEWFFLIKSLIIFLIRLYSWLIKSFGLRLTIQWVLPILSHPIVVGFFQRFQKCRNSSFQTPIPVCFIIVALTILIYIVVFWIWCD
jgi:hypothetical protein